MTETVKTTVDPFAADERTGHARVEPLWRHLVGDVLRRERRAQGRTLRDVADAARISMPYLSEVERGRKEASSEVLAAAAHALGLSLADLLALAGAELARPVRVSSLTRRAGAGAVAGSGSGSGSDGGSVAGPGGAVRRPAPARTTGAGSRDGLALAA
ncbi:helix-turn-helix domain-containing protein [Streptomyces sp. NPDC015131]|uniref:helix-turn-helix domain-containing protein n=1 Tax=Streptomyces sp. NPDC015131 TaxID=3364941 RepID=UPI0036F688FC